MRITEYAILALLSLALLPSSGVCDDTAGGTAIPSPQMAVDRAFAYTGFNELKRISGAALSEQGQLMSVVTDETPFLSDSVVGRRVWRVKMNNIFLDLSKCGRQYVENQRPKNYEAWIDSATGVMYKIFSEPVENDPDLVPEPSADTATAMMRPSGDIYLGFPAQPPAISFLEALGNAVGSNPLVAKEIIAWCVLISDSTGSPMPVWQIIGRGIPPFEIHPRPLLPMYLRNRQRSTVDAITGNLLSISNCPSVLRREEDQ